MAGTSLIKRRASLENSVSILYIRMFPWPVLLLSREVPAMETLKGADDDFVGFVYDGRIQ